MQNDYRPPKEEGTGEQTLELFRLSVNTAPVAVLWNEKGGKVIYVNDRMCESLGYTREEILNLSIWDLDAACTPEDLAQKTREAIESAQLASRGIRLFSVIP